MPHSNRYLHDLLRVEEILEHSEGGVVDVAARGAGRRRRAARAACGVRPTWA